MNKIDWSDLGARQLQVLVTVLEEGSVTRAAVRLDVTQSAVSHALDRLRSITGDPLFVKSGRGIAPTAHARNLGVEARRLLRQLEDFARAGEFDPAQWRATVVIAANDFQRDLLLPTFARRLRAGAPGVTLKIVDSAIPEPDDLRQDRVQLVISPRPPDGADIVKRKLFADELRVFYDPAVRKPPASREEFLAADHATIAYGDGRRLDIDNYWASRGVSRHFSVMVPGFAALPGFIRGTALLATAPGLMANRTLHELAHVATPIPAPQLPMFAIWHARYHADPSHRWLRALLDRVVEATLPGREARHGGGGS